MKRVLVANRGEIALRAIKACRRVGLEAVAVYSTADRASAHVFAADEAICIGPPASRDSYLQGGALIDVALGAGCDAIYPGYGFLSEDPEFVSQCEKAGLIFVGPGADIIRKMGDKAVARATVSKLGVRVVPGSEHAYRNAEEARKEAVRIGFPLLVKASAGGGGRGMRVVRSDAEFVSEFGRASSEAESAFGNGELYLERFFDRVKHIEVQVMGDKYGNVCHLWERDCSVQRRHQKIVEESPSPILEVTERERICDAALTIAKGIGYVNAGTVEFIVDMETREFFFIEMNTRIQVEHPVTEMLTDTDLVAEQLRIAAGETLAIQTPGAVSDRHCIEWRICAEDPDNGFMPCPGRVEGLNRVEDADVRFDSHVYPDYRISHYYDSMIGKLIVRGTSRQDAINKSQYMLTALGIKGVATNVPFHLRLLGDNDFLSGTVDTRWVDRMMEQS